MNKFPSAEAVWRLHEVEMKLKGLMEMCVKEMKFEQSKLWRSRESGRAWGLYAALVVLQESTGGR